MQAKYRNFTDAYKDFRGEKWVWKKEDGTENHPLFSEDMEIRAFYRGWYLAKQGQKELLEMKSNFEFLNDRFKELEKKLNLALKG